MTFRPASPSDIPALLPMVERICDFHRQLDPAKYGFLPEPSRRYERWLEARSQDERSVFLVVERTQSDESTKRESHEGAGGGPVLVGFLVATTEKEIPIYRVTEFGFVHDLWVEPAYRNEGIGRQLVMLAIERFRQIGVDQLRLDVAAGNEPARKLFESCGLRAATLEMLVELK